MSESIVQFNESALKGELKDLVRSSVEETLNALLDQEAEELVNAGRYVRWSRFSDRLMHSNKLVFV